MGEDSHHFHAAPNPFHSFKTSRYATLYFLFQGLERKRKKGEEEIQIFVGEEKRRYPDYFKIYFQSRGDKNFRYYRKENILGYTSGISFLFFFFFFLQALLNGVYTYMGKMEEKSIHRPPIVTVVERWIKVTMRLQLSGNLEIME